MTGVQTCALPILIIAPWKMAILDYFGDGSATGLDIGYLYQEEARGLPRALDLAYPWTHSAHVAFAMPDTIIRPGDCFVTLRERYETTGADLLLGVFPTGEPQRLGPVVIEDGKVKAVYDKCPEPPVRNTWGVALWGPAFSALMHEEVKRRVTSECEPVLGELFNLAVAAGLNVRAHFFPSGAYFDIGTPQGLRGCLDGLGIPRLEQLGP